MSAFLEKHVKANSKYIYNTDSEYNICIWVAIARWLNPKMKTCSLLAFAKKMFFEVNAKSFEKFKKEHKVGKDNNYGPAYLSQYKGMVISEENLKAVIGYLQTKLSKEIAIQLRDVDTQTNDKVTYKYGPYYVNPSTTVDEFGNNVPKDKSVKSEDILYLLVVMNPDTGKGHTLLVTDADKLTNCKCCPKCHRVFKNVLESKKNHYDYKHHVMHCEGKKSKPLTTTESILFASHIQKNCTYSWLLARDRIKEFKVTKYYMVWDFEAMHNYIILSSIKQKMDKRQIQADGIAKTKLIAVVEALSIAIAYHGNTSKHPHGFYKTDFFSIKKDGPEFMHKIIARAFEMAEYIADDNKYEDPDIPYNYMQVPLLGYNSAKFDMNLLLNELECKD
jgi:hypothetical protein